MAVSATTALIATATTAITTTATAVLVKTFVVTFVISAISRALAPKPNLGNNTGLSTTVKSPTQARPVIYGRTRTAGTLVYVQTTGDDNKYLHLVQAMAGHPIDGYEKIYINDELAWENGTTVAKFADKVRFKTYDGTQTTADTDLVTESSEWDSTCVLNDTPYIYVRLEYDTDLFANGIPNITATLRGKKVYDPRTSTTAYSDNPALCLADYINDTKYGLKNVTINQASLIASANVCDQQVNYTPTQTHNRFALNGYIDSGEKVSANIENMLTSMFGSVVYSQGELHLNAGYYSDPVLDIDESMVVGEMTLQTKQSRRAQYNAVKGVFLSSENNYVLADYPSQVSSTYATEDGEPIYLDMSLPFTTDNYRAQRLAKLALGKSRQQRVITVPVNLAGLKLRAGDNIRITNEKLGINDAIYEVLDFELDYSSELTVNLVCVETGASVYDWTLADQQDFSVSSDVTLWDGSALPPTNLVATAVTNIETDGTTSVYIDVSWTAPNDVYFDYYVLKYGSSSITTKDTSYRINNVDQNTTVDIELVAYNVQGRKSTALTASVNTSPDTTAPSQPTSISATGGIKHITLDWTNPSDDDFDVVEIKANTADNESTATLIATVKVDNFIHDIGANSATRYYYLRSKDRTGNTSEWTTAVSATTVKVESGDLDVNELSDISTDLGSITGGSLDIGGGTFTVDSLGNMVATSATIEGRGTFGDGIVASSESGTLEVGRAISDGTVKVGSQLGYYSSNGGYTHESFIEFRLTDMRIFMGEGTGNFKFEGGNNTGYDFERPVTFSEPVEMFDTTTGTGYTWIKFLNGDGSTQYGAIYRSYSSMVYGTSSDYRLKNNVVELTGACARLRQIPVKRFSFIEHPEKTVDGFLAHEVQEIVPEAIVGEKDQTDQDGNPIYQVIDQSKLVPLLTKALQEALDEIDDLKLRISALEN